MPPRDQPTPEETAELVEALRVAVETSQDRVDDFTGSTVARSPDRVSAICVRPEGAMTRLTQWSLGELVARRRVDTAVLVAVLERDGQSYGTLAALLEDDV